jgi:hypothetical protein
MPVIVSLILLDDFEDNLTNVEDFDTFVVACSGILI